MMRWTILFFVMNLFFQSCSNEKKNSEPSPQTKKTVLSKDTLSSESIFIQKRDSLLQYFDFVKSDLPSASYYNKAWWQHYWLREHILMAGVDSIGNYFLTMTTFFPPGAKTNHSEPVEVMVYTKTDSAHTQTILETDTILMNYEKQHPLIGTWNPEFHVYDRNACKEVMEFISTHRNENMHFILLRNGKKYDGPHSVGKKSRMAISQCYELGSLLSQWKNFSVSRTK